jgi:hypothetical protein
VFRVRHGNLQHHRYLRIHCPPASRVLEPAAAGMDQFGKFSRPMFVVKQSTGGIL